MYILCQIHKYEFQLSWIWRFKLFPPVFLKMWQHRRVLSMFISYRESVRKITDRHEETWKCFDNIRWLSSIEFHHREWSPIWVFYRRDFNAESFLESLSGDGFFIFSTNDCRFGYVTLLLDIFCTILNQFFHIRKSFYLAIITLIYLFIFYL